MTHVHDGAAAAGRRPGLFPVLCVVTLLVSATCTAGPTAAPASSNVVPAGPATTAAAPRAGSPTGLSPAASADPWRVEAQLGDQFFDPLTFVVKVGTVITWRNGGSQQHDVTALEGSFRSITLSMGDTFSHTFAGPGRFPYFCSIHPTEMRAEVVVEPAN